MGDSDRIPHHLLLVSSGLGARLSAERVFKAVSAGLLDAGSPAPDLCQVSEDAHQGPSLQALLEQLDFDGRMRRARALVLAVAALWESTLAGSMVFELATRARQAGVPCYAITAENRLDAFDMRILDLQLVLQARSPNALRKAGAKLAGIV